MPDARDDVAVAPRRQPGGYRRVPDPRALPMISERASCERPRRVLATIEAPFLIRKILTHLGLPTQAPAPQPPPADLFDWN
jgi:hypothetical protein